MTKWHPTPEVLAAAKRWKERCLLDDGSVFTDRRLWTAENFDSLDRFYVKNLQYGKGDFYGKLEMQLGPAPAAAKQLAAEVLWLMFLYVYHAAMGGPVKRAQIRKVWEWSGEPLPDSEALAEVLDRGVGRPGTAYQTYRWKELVFAVDAFRSWKSVLPTERDRLAADPWAFAEWLDRVPTSQNRQFREILLYLLFPDSFERMSTGRDKRAVVRAFLEKENKKSEDFKYEDRVRVDREVLRIREVWSPKLGADKFDFYDSPARHAWRSDPPKETIDPSPVPALDAWFARTFGKHRVWAIAAGAGGRWWPEFQKQSVVGIGLDDLGDLSQYEDRDDVQKAMVDIGQLEHEPVIDSLAAWNFAHVMQAGDHILAKTGSRT